MPIDITPYINSFLLPSIIAILVFGAVLNVKYTEKNSYRKYLVAMLIFWVSIFALIFIKYIISKQLTISYNNEVLSAQVLLLGIPCFLSIISYPIVILNSLLLKPRNWWRACYTIILAVIIYFAGHLILWVNPFIKYSNYQELLANITSASVILRLYLIGVFICYIIKHTINIWSIIPLYNRYVHDNIADSECNVDWIYRLLKHTIAVSVFYFAMLFNSTPIINMLYLISVLLLFSYIVEMSLFKKTSENVNPIVIRRDRRSRKWYVVEESTSKRTQSVENLKSVVLKIDTWMREDKPYTNVNFTTKDIIAKFPFLTPADLTNIFKSKGENFQSYVRRYRIYRACEIITNNNDKIYPKQLFDRVGFSHYSSFSRSFLAVTGLTPFNYINLPKKEKERHLSDIEHITPPETHWTSRR